MAAPKRFTDIPISVNMTPQDRDKIRRIATEDNVSENAVVRYLIRSSNNLDGLLEEVFDPEEGGSVRIYRVPRDA